MASKIIQRRQIAEAVPADARLEAIEDAIAVLLIDARSRVRSAVFEKVHGRIRQVLGQPEEELVPEGQEKFDALIRRRASTLEKEGKPIEALLLLRKHGA